MSVLWRRISNPGGFAGGVTRGRSEERNAAGDRKGRKGRGKGGKGMFEGQGGEEKGREEKGKKGKKREKQR